MAIEKVSAIIAHPILVRFRHIDFNPKNPKTGDVDENDNFVNFQDPKNSGIFQPFSFCHIYSVDSGILTVYLE
jgi:hypothetical protein